jgi:hypothetical protein
MTKNKQIDEKSYGRVSCSVAFLNMGNEKVNTLVDMACTSTPELIL